MLIQDFDLDNIIDLKKNISSKGFIVQSFL